MSYYDGTKLLSLSDINGQKPEIYIATTNRTGGKTTYFSRLLMNRFFKQSQKFALIYRFIYELDDCAEKFYKDIKTLFFPGTNMTSKRKARGIYHELYLDGDPCGYAIALNSADQIKRYSHLFSDVSCMFFDEFQSETNHYCDNEVEKFISLHVTIARGQLKQIRYVPVYMCSNAVTLINPYYTAMGIAERLNSETKFLRGEGYVLEQGYVESAAQAQLCSGFNKAFASNAYVEYAAQNVYLNDNLAFVERPAGQSRYIATINYNGKPFAIREFRSLGYMYCDDHADPTFPTRITVTVDDHSINTVLLRKNDLFIATLRQYFERGFFRFKNLQSKQALIKCISY